MNVQTERIDNHKAQFTVEIEANQLDEAKKSAAKRLSRQVRIKGFRKGKAPYRVVAQYVGEPAILEEAIEILGNDIYKQALDESKVNPYGPGALEDFRLEPTPTFVFTVPLQPEVDLKEYRDVRVEFTAPEVKDEQIDFALEQLRQREAEVEGTAETVEVGNRITVDVHSHFADGEEADEDEESDDDGEAEESSDSDEDKDTPYVPKKGDEFYHRHAAKLVLDPENEPIVPGFVNAIAGATVGEEVEFELSIPEDDEDFKDIAGRVIEFHVTVTEAEVIKLPELDDEFAKNVTEPEGETLTLAQLRDRTREDLEKDANNRARSEYGDSVLDKVIEGADVSYPELMVEERIEDMVNDLDNNMRQQGMNLETYMRITGTTKETIGEQYRESAIASVKRTLVLRELLNAEKVEISDEQIEKRLDDMMIQFGAQGDQFRKLIDTPQMRDNIMNDILLDNVMTRLVAIGKGEDPEEAVKTRAAEIEEENEKARAQVEKMMQAQAEAEAVEEEATEANDVVEAVDGEVEEPAEDEEETDSTEDDE